jgi:hypothetical protein
MANLDLAAPSTAILSNLQDFDFLSRASRPSRNQLRKLSGLPFAGSPRALFRADFMRVFRWDAQKQPDAPASTSASQADCRAT